jgi:hypothetical protein
MKSAVFYSGADTDLILILFKQAGDTGAASTLSNSIITLGNSGIVPAAFSEYGIIPSIGRVSTTATALSTGITPTLIKKLCGFGISPPDYTNHGITGAESAEVVAEALGALKPLGLATEQNVCYFEREREFVYIDCHKPQDMYQVIVQCLKSEKEKIYNSLYKRVKLRQEFYGQPINNDIIDWMHPSEKYKNGHLAYYCYFEN